MVNRENVTKVADAIENHSIKWLGFNMDSWLEKASDRYASGRDKSGHKCGTVGCIGGWTDVIRLNLTEDSDHDQVLNLPDHESAAFLGLSAREGASLFHPYEIRDWTKITPAHAVRVLRHLAETGKVDWSQAGAP